MYVEGDRSNNRPQHCAGHERSGWRCVSVLKLWITARIFFIAMDHDSPGMIGDKKKRPIAYLKGVIYGSRCLS